MQIQYLSLVIDGQLCLKMIQSHKKIARMDVLEHVRDHVSPVLPRALHIFVNPTALSLRKRSNLMEVCFPLVHNRSLTMSFKSLVDRQGGGAICLQQLQLR